MSVPALITTSSTYATSSREARDHCTSRCPRPHSINAAQMARSTSSRRAGRSRG
ncbi:hypothetical protein [Nannocystis pusilla]|uniref:hypothetical protein n=1 Tax=Nannocystis pusilla TaxID=889268 RepID=UPI003B812790